MKGQKQLIVLLGDYGVGKTTYAKKYAKRVNGLYLDVDILNRDSRQLANKLKGLIASNGHSKFILDGAPSFMVYSDVVEKELGCEVNYRVCFASPNIIQYRQCRKRYIKDKLPRSIGDIISTTHHCAVIALAKSNRVRFVDTLNGKIYKFKQWLPYWQELCFMANKSNEYQDIELKHIKTIGLSASYKTWDRLASVYDFAGKSILDIGSNLGYFLFKAEEAGARRLVGIDKSNSVVEVAREIADLRGSKVIFRLGDIATIKAQGHYDCILCLNILHHIGNAVGVLDKLGRIGAEIIIIEIPIKLLKTVQSRFGDYGYSSVFKLNSHRYNRVIAGYGKITTVPIVSAKYPYTKAHYRVQRIVKILYQAIGVAGAILRKLHLRGYK